MTSIDELPFDVGIKVYTIIDMKIKTAIIDGITVEDERYIKTLPNGGIEKINTRKVSIRLSGSSNSYTYKDGCICRQGQRLYFFSEAELIDSIVNSRS